MAPASKTPPTTQDVYLDCECDAALDKMTAAIAKAKRVVVAVGAGISTSAGVPDFRTKTSGLYARAGNGNAAGGDDHQPDDGRARRAATGTATSPTKTASKATTKRADSNLLKGPAMFTSSVYTAVSTRTAHWQFMTRLKRSVDHIASASIPPKLTSSSTALPSSPSRSTRASAEKREKGVTKTHAFFDTLHRRGQLGRVYTQNIDGFELTSGQLEGVGIEGIRVQADHVDYSERSSKPKGKGKAKAQEWTGDVVQLHGSLGRVKCSSCAWVGEWDERHSNAFEKGMSVDCPACVSQAELRVCGGKRALVLRSFVRPSIVLYGERSPAEQSIGSIITCDLSRKPDLLIVMGTTLKIPGFKRLVVDMSREVRKNGGLAIFVNREKNAAAMWKKVFDYQGTLGSRSQVIIGVIELIRLDPSTRTVIGSTDDFVDRLLKRWKQTRPADWQKQATLNDTFTVAKPSQVVVSKPVQPVPPITSSSSSTRTPWRDPNFSLGVPGPGTPPSSPLKRRSSCSDRTNLPSMDKLPETPSKRRSPRKPRTEQEQEQGPAFDFDYDHLDQLSKTRYPRMDQISDPPSTPFRMPVLCVPKSPPTPTRKVLPRSPRRAVAR